MKKSRRDFIKKGASIAALSTAGLPAFARSTVIAEGAGPQLCMAYFFGFQDLAAHVRFVHTQGVAGSIPSPVFRHV